MTAVLRGWTQLSPEVRDFEFEASGAEGLNFLPGQFVSFTADVGGKRITRAYSIASKPDGNRFHLCLNRVPDGHLSPLLFDSPVGTAIDMQGPLGTFTVRDPGVDMILAATGTGVAPFRSMIAHHLESGGAGAMTLLLGVRYRENLLYGSEFSEWARRNPRFRFEPVLSRPPADWAGRTGHIQPHLIELIGERRDLHVYACGMKAMVDDVRGRLKSLGFDRKQIIVEKYD
ncbi:MAG: oxidoreductase [Acidobacteria bacterium]|nr:oxidoreductase [Acidobacteriota bacterium]